MEDTGFDFDANIKKTRVGKWDHVRYRKSRGRFKEFSPENYEIFDDEYRLLGATLMGVPDGAYVFDTDCEKVFPVEDWDEHILNEHMIPASREILTTNTPTHEL